MPGLPPVIEALKGFWSLNVCIQFIKKPPNAKSMSGDVTEADLHSFNPGSFAFFETYPHNLPTIYVG